MTGFKQPLVLEATGLPTEQQPLPSYFIFFISTDLGRILNKERVSMFLCFLFFFLSSFYLSSFQHQNQLSEPIWLSSCC